MKLKRLRLADFRNITFTEVPFEHDRIFLLGENGQGKTNVLESIGLLPALRSFRTQDTALLIRHGAAAAQTAYLLEHEIEGTADVVLTLTPKKKTVLVDGTAVRSFSEFLGRFPAVPFCSGDIELLRGAPAVRRRWLDMVVAADDPGYLDALRRYHAALSGRNLLLRQGALDSAQLLAFEKVLAPCAARLTATRRDALSALALALAHACAQIGLPENAAGLAFAPNAAPEGGDAGWLDLFARQRTADILLHSTQRGPHRDDFSFLFGGRAARDTASEGQQRGLVLGLELAWLERLRSRRPVAPIVLADDILGELDPLRKAGFWRALGGGCQVIATGTTLPEDSGNWQVRHVRDGVVE